MLVYAALIVLCLMGSAQSRPLQQLPRPDSTTEGYSTAPKHEAPIPPSRFENISTTAMPPSRPFDKLVHCAFAEPASYDKIQKIFEHGLRLIRNEKQPESLRPRGSDVDEQTRALISLLRRKTDLDQYQACRGEAQVDTPLLEADQAPWCAEELGRHQYTPAQKRKILALADAGMRLETLSKKYKHFQPRYLSRYRKCAQESYSNVEKSRIVKQAVKKIFDETRDRGIDVRGRDLLKWARDEAEKIGYRFKGSEGWLHQFKTENGIASRRKTHQFVGARVPEHRIDPDLVTEFQYRYDVLRPFFRPRVIWNFDQSPFNYEGSQCVLEVEMM